MAAKSLSSCFTNDCRWFEMCIQQLGGIYFGFFFYPMSGR